MGTRGETNFNTGSRTARKVVFTPVPNGDHEGKLNCSGVAVKMPGPDSKSGVPYIGGLRVEILNSAMEEGQGNRSVFHNLFISMKPWKNGAIGPDGADQIVGLAKSVGETADLPIIQFTTPSGEEVDIIDPKAVVQWLKDHDGALLKLHTKIKKDPNYGDKAEIKYFIETEEANAFGANEDEEEVVEAEPEPEEEVEVKFKAKPATRTAAKPAAKKRA